MLHQELMTDAKKHTKTTYAEVLCALLEDLPMGVLALLYLQQTSNKGMELDTLICLSTVISFFELGRKFAKAPQLKELWLRRMKHARKLQRVSLEEGDLADWLKRMQQLKGYAPLFEGNGKTVSQMLEVYSDVAITNMLPQLICCHN